ncbi:hypothetical protein H9Q74_009117 [Fusarium xylarioides]|nr:hypothetical protein H9Q71_009825 [Fusarium xylarioides]KAG5820001.1 hypothetical protein H9Q74_009117 [Fusarium xylarioides]
MVSPCLSRLLLFIVVGATNVVAHPLNKDNPAEPGSVAAQRSPSLEWKPKEENHQHHHVHHGSQESTVIFQKITVNLDDKDGSKHNPEANGDEESAKTEYLSEAPSKHDKNMGTTYNHKDAKKPRIDFFGPWRPRPWKNWDKYSAQHNIDKSKLDGVKKPKYNLFDEAKKRKNYEAQRDKNKEDKGYKPKDDESKLNPTIYKRHEASHHKHELAPTEEKGVEKKTKIERRCLQMLVGYLIGRGIHKKKAKKMAKNEKNMIQGLNGMQVSNWPMGSAPKNPGWFKKVLADKKQRESMYAKPKTNKEKGKNKSNEQLGTKLEHYSHDNTSKAFDKTPIEEKETRKNKGSGFNSNRPGSAALKKKQDEEKKQKSEVQSNTASEYPLDKDAKQGKKSLAARFPPGPSVSEMIRKAALRKARREGRIGNNSYKSKEEKLHTEKKDEGLKDSTEGHAPAEKKGDYSQGQEEKTNSASEYSKDELSNQRLKSPVIPAIGHILAPAWVWQRYRPTQEKWSRRQKVEATREKASAKSKHPKDIDE